MPGFLVHPGDVGEGILILRDEEARHLAKVRRHRPGDRIEAIDGEGGFFRACVVSVEKGKVVCRILESRRNQGESRVRLCLAPSLLKGHRFDFVVEKATEVGVDAIHPLVSSRGVVRSGSAGKVERWRRLAREAAKQCGRSRIPEVFPPVPLEEALDRLVGEADLVLVAAPSGGSGDLSALFAVRRPRRVGLLIGPEGGFSSGEIALARTAGAECFSWGDRVLRADTAGVVLSALLLHEAERAVTASKGGGRVEVPDSDPARPQPQSARQAGAGAVRPGDPR